MDAKQIIRRTISEIEIFVDEEWLDEESGFARATVSRSDLELELTAERVDGDHFALYVFEDNARLIQEVQVPRMRSEIDRAVVSGFARTVFYLLNNHSLRGHL